MKSQTLIFSLLLLVSIVTSGCVGQNSSNLAEITENPEEYVGEEVTLRGQIQIKKDESVISQKAAESTVASDTIRAKNAERKIGNLEGDLPIVGECYQSDYASEVKVRGEIKSYETCNCEVVNRTVSRRENSTIFLFHEERSMIKTSDKSLYNDMAGFPSGESELTQITGDDFRRINQSVNENLIRILNLQSLGDDETIPEGNYWENGTLDSEGNYPTGAGRVVPREYKYSLSENSVIIQRNEIDEEKINGDVLSAICKSQKEIKVPVNYNEHREIEFKGCKRPAEEQYYFSCAEVVEQYE